MTLKRTIKILSPLAMLTLAACQVLPPSDVFVRRLSLHHPNNPHALFLEGKSYLAQGQAGKAAVRFRAVLQLQPDFEEARLGLAHAYRRDGYYRRARALYREVLQKTPRNVQAIEGLAIAEAHLGNPDKAVALLKTALAMEATSVPTRVSLLNSLADIHYGQRRYPEALKHWEESLQLDPSQSELRETVEDLRGYVRKYHSP